MNKFTSKGNLLYKRFHKNKKQSLTKMKGSIQWFALEKDYGSEDYGEILHSYKIKTDLKLLDLGKVNIRAQIQQDLLSYFTDKDKKYIEHVIDPDEQYSGGKSNNHLHKMIMTVYGNQYDGTFIHELHCDDEELEGATEIVLWSNKFTNLLQQIKIK
jgi:hypothetical protein